MFPLYEMENGKVRVTRKGKGLPVSEYLKLQGRFGHLSELEVAAIQKAVDEFWAYLLAEESTGLSIDSEDLK
jgi:pyruvate/2-oxoacid:ferredoxin oxidoreductase beta subunit